MSNNKWHTVEEYLSVLEHIERHVVSLEIMILFFCEPYVNVRFYERLCEIPKIVRNMLVELMDFSFDENKVSITLWANVTKEAMSRV